ncbi:hypothetical protein ILP92_07815 [Maribius pontilimi]|uniref:Uncharacterized protein n=1 Tax=Palleronia pontilimi TaxID=1964209 RepID=A0A934MGR9_9RHOB|nr:hypothetical protein [Palleronia pontilimi]MBJ3762649.1 hypothetical protein [Palleronia pontilimi]
MAQTWTFPTIAAACLLATSASAHDAGGWQQGWGGNHMMGPGWGMGQMMGRGHGPGPMMGPGYGSGPQPDWRGGAGPGYGYGQPLQQDLGTDDVLRMIEQRLAWMNNPNLKPGQIDERDADTIIAEIVTQDGSLVERLAVDRHTGWMQPIR